MFKLVQRQTYDFFTQKYAISGCFLGLVVIVISALSFGEVLIDWSREKYTKVYSFYSDNLKEKSLQSKLCQYLPIDVVYTWVNGTDPVFLSSLDVLRSEIEKHETEKNATETPEKCPFKPCLDSHMVVVNPSLPGWMTIGDLSKMEPLFRSTIKIATKLSHINRHQNVSIISLDSIEAAQRCAARGFLLNNGTNHTVAPGYLTTDWMAQNTVLLDDTLIITGIPPRVMEDQLIDRIPRRLQPLITKVSLFRDQGIAVVTVAHTMALESLLLLDGNFTFGYRDPTFSAASLVLDFPRQRLNEEIGRSRFEDNEELRYSLRSLEKHAPWVRNIYVVTNGQIPYWINLDNPRITIVTHREIFANVSHLPTFSSPAIEVHLHRIPGLSRKFLYLNDDVMFGRDVWPDDFYTHARGQKVYLAWSVPDCREGCPTSWISDGYCDRGCNNSDCQHDGGDCLGDVAGGGGGPGAVVSSELDGWQDELEKMYCQPNCATMWIADKYCDTSCNVWECAFDGGDCGVDDFHQMVGVHLNRNQTMYMLPPGVCQMYFNLSAFLGAEGSVQGGWFDVEPKAVSAVRAVAVNQKSKVLTLLLSENRYVAMTISLQGIESKHPFVFNFNVTANTTTSNDVRNPTSTAGTMAFGDLKFPLFRGKAVDAHAESSQHPNMLFTFGPEQEYPQARTRPSGERDLAESDYAFVNETAMDLPAGLLHNISRINDKLVGGELTNKGARKAKARMMQKYFEQLSESKLSAPKLVLLDKLSRDFQQATTIIEPTFRISHRDGVTVATGHRTWVSETATARQHQIRGPYHDAPVKAEGVFGNPGNPHASTTNRRLHHFGDLFRKLDYQANQKDGRHHRRQSTEASTYTTGRRLLDTFGDSLRHANRLLNEQYGFEARKVPAHMAHMIDADVMTQLQARFPRAFDATSSHRTRHPQDVQLAFAYFYFLMSERLPFDASTLFDEYDTDGSGTLADRELRTLLTRLYSPPVTYEKMRHLEALVSNCSEHLPPEFSSGLTAPPFEHYLDSNTPIVTKQLVLHCDPLLALLRSHLKENSRYNFEIVGEEEVAFKMIHINISQVVKQLDDIRARPRKFICLNDNIDHASEEAATVKAILVDFYESLFPNASQFELPAFYRNRFLHVDELRAWRRYRDLLRLVTYTALGVLVLVALASYFHHRISGLWRQMFRRRGPRNRTTTI